MLLSSPEQDFDISAQERVLNPSFVSPNLRDNKMITESTNG